jgi:hypothetical protein
MPLPQNSPKRSMTDDALLLLAITRRALAAGPIGLAARTQSRAAGFGTREPRVIQAEAALVRLVSIAEAYTNALMLVLIDEAVLQPAPLVATALSQLEPRLTASWPARQGGFRSLLGIELAALPQWAQLDAATRVRNTIAHGLGEISRPRGSKELAKDAKLIGARVAGNRCHLGDDTVRIVLDACSQFISALDSKS